MADYSRKLFKRTWALRLCLVIMEIVGCEVSKSPCEISGDVLDILLFTFTAVLVNFRLAIVTSILKGV